MCSQTIALCGLRARCLDQALPIGIGYVQALYRLLHVLIDAALALFDARASDTARKLLLQVRINCIHDREAAILHLLDHATDRKEAVLYSLKELVGFALGCGSAEAVLCLVPNNNANALGEPVREIGVLSDLLLDGGHVVGASLSVQCGSDRVHRAARLALPKHRLDRDRLEHGSHIAQRCAGVTDIAIVFDIVPEIPSIADALLSLADLIVRRTGRQVLLEPSRVCNPRIEPARIDKCTMQDGTKLGLLHIARTGVSLVFAWVDTEEPKTRPTAALSAYQRPSASEGRVNARQWLIGPVEQLHHVIALADRKLRPVSALVCILWEHGISGPRTCKLHGEVECCPTNTRHRVLRSRLLTEEHATSGRGRCDGALRVCEALVGEDALLIKLLAVKLSSGFRSDD